MCRRASAQDHQTQSVDQPASQTVLSAAVSQYAVYTSGQQQFFSPVILLPSDGSSPLPSSAVQLVTIAPSDANFTDGPDVNLTNSSVSVKHQSDAVTSVSRLPNGDAALEGNSEDRVLNGVCKSSSVADDGVSKSLLVTVDAQPQSCSATVADTSDNADNSVDGVSSVPASPTTRPTYNTRRRRSMSSLPRTSEPALRALKRSTTRHMSSDQPQMKKAAAENDNLPLILSCMTE